LAKLASLTNGGQKISPAKTLPKRVKAAILSDEAVNL
jgi:hypothetical protein